MIESADDIGGGPALVYCRVSTDLLAKGTSLESQGAACAEHAERLGYTVTRVTEEVFSGAELFDRPKLARDRADIRAGKFKAVIAYTVDRLTRNPAHLAILSDECDRAGCRMVFVTGEEGSTPADEAYAAEVERLKLSERVSRGRRAKLLQGRPVFTGWDLYGYRADREAGTYVVYKPEASVVRRVFSMCAEWYGMHSIAAALNSDGIPSPKSDRRPGARWSSSAISDLLNNRSYMGEEICWKTRRGARKRDFPRPEPEQVRLPEGVRPAIVSRELWEKCQQGIRERAARMKNRRERPSLLRGHIFCAECGAHLIRNRYKQGKYEYLKYRCGSRWRPYDTGCRGEAVPGYVVEGWVWESVKKVLSEPDAIGRALGELEEADSASHLISDLDAIKRIREHVAAQATRELRQLEKTIAELERRIGEARQGMDDLRALRDCCARQNLDDFDFDGRRLALRALGFKAFANGDDPARWRYEVGISLKDRVTNPHDGFPEAVRC